MGRKLGIEHAGNSLLRDDQAGELVTHQEETGAHHGNVGGVGMAPEAGGTSPVAHDNQNGTQGQELADLDADVEGNQVGDQAVRRDLVFLDLGRQAEAMQQAENQRGRLGIRLVTEPALKRAQVIQCLVHHRETDDGVDHIGANADVRQYAEQQGHRVTHGEQRDVKPYILESVEEKDHPEQEQQVVVTGDHMLGAHVDERQQHHPGAFLDKALVALGDSVGQRIGHAEKQQCREQQQQ
ncbi:hypothetical protein G6F24_010176 [Rhizopus arrhizus]|nr:hypothetical protein G6F24_010176 [Rhizopus arrhizus]